MQEKRREPSRQSFDGRAGTKGIFPGSPRATVEKILPVDKDMMAPVYAEKSAISHKLNPIGKLKQYFDNPSIPQVLERDGLIA